MIGLCSNSHSLRTDLGPSLSSSFPLSVSEIWGRDHLALRSLGEVLLDRLKGNLNALFFPLEVNGTQIILEPLCPPFYPILRG